MTTTGAIVLVASVVASCGLAACRDSGAVSSAPSTREQLRGTWRVVSFTQVDRNDSTVSYPLGEHLRGYLMYDGVGHMSFQAVGADALDSLRLGVDRGAPKDQLFDVISGYQAYFGTYSADSATVTHRIEGELPVRGGSFEVSMVFHVDNDSLTLGSDRFRAWRFVRVK